MKPPYVYYVTTAIHDRTETFAVDAEYMVEEGSMVVLKDAGHSVVFAAATHYVLSVVRQDRKDAPKGVTAHPVRDSYDQARHDLLDHGRSSR